MEDNCFDTDVCCESEENIKPMYKIKMYKPDNIEIIEYSTYVESLAHAVFEESASYGKYSAVILYEKTPKNRYKKIREWKLRERYIE